MFESEGPRVRTKRMCKGVRTDSCTTEASVGAPLPPTANLYTYKLKKAKIPTRHSAHARDVPALPTRKANNVMKIRNPGPTWALHMLKRLVGSQKFVTEGPQAEGPATALGRRPKNGGELHT